MLLGTESHCTKVDRNNSNFDNGSFRNNWVWYIRGMRLLLIITGLIAWFGTQALLGARPDPGDKINDVLHKWTTAANVFLHENSYWSTTLLIVSSVIVDLSGVFLLGTSLFGPTLRPFLTLVILFLTRQICQALIALPTPEGIIWYHPGFPSLLVTYDVSNDLFFSGHTGIAVVTAVEFARANSRVGMLFGMLLVVFEVSAVIVLRSHYTMDIFAGAIMALLASVAANWAVSPIESDKNSKVVQEKRMKTF